MSKNILLVRRNKKKQMEIKKKFHENIKKQQEEVNIKSNKYNPDVKIKYQKDKNTREKIIEPSCFKIENSIIKEKNEDLNKLLQSKISERSEKITFTKKPFKKRIITSGSESYQNQKETIEKLKKLMDEKIQKGKEANDAILSHYDK